MAIKRATISFTEEDLRRLDDLRQDLGLSSTAQTVSVAIRYADEIVHRVKKGDNIIIEGRDGKTSNLIIPGLAPRDL